MIFFFPVWYQNRYQNTNWNLVCDKPVLCLSVLQETPVDTATAATMIKINLRDPVIYTCPGKTLVEGSTLVPQTSHGQSWNLLCAAHFRTGHISSATAFMLLSLLLSRALGINQDSKHLHHIFTRIRVWLPLSLVPPQS